MRTLENTFPRQRAWRVGISPSRRRPQARFRPRSSIRRKTCTLIVPLSPCPTTAPAILMATYQHISLRLTYFTPATPGGTGITVYRLFHRRPYQGHDQGGGDEPGQSHRKDHHH